MTGRHLRCVRVFACAWFVGSVVIGPASAAGVTGCDGWGAPFAIAEAAGVRDALTIRLTDGREVRLAGIAANLDEQSGTALRAKTVLDQLVAGRRVALHGSGSVDRYGRLTAQVVLAGPNPMWLQVELVIAGMAFAAPDSGSPACAKALIESERVARRQRAGFWNDGALAVKRASAPQSLLAGVGGFAVVEGTVARVGEAGGRLFLDFGRRYGRDFSIVVPREAQASFAKAGLDLRALSGKRVRARGVVFEQSGPAMELRDAAALEVIGADGA
jgi:endonuclease YncB( thermonuclease family)